MADNGYSDPFSDYWMAEEGYNNPSPSSSSSNSSSSSSDYFGDYYIDNSPGNSGGSSGGGSSGGSSSNGGLGDYYIDNSGSEYSSGLGDGTDYGYSSSGGFGDYYIDNGSQYSSGLGDGSDSGYSSSGGFGDYFVDNSGSGQGGNESVFGYSSGVGDGASADPRSAVFDDIWNVSQAPSGLQNALNTQAAERALGVIDALTRSHMAASRGQPEQTREERLRSVQFDDLWGDLEKPTGPYIDFNTIWNGLYANPSAAPRGMSASGSAMAGSTDPLMALLAGTAAMNPSMTAGGRASAGGTDPLAALLSGSAAFAPRAVDVPGQPAGSVVQFKDDSRLATAPSGLPLMYDSSTPASDLVTRTVQLVPIDPTTGMPAPAARSGPVIAPGGPVGMRPEGNTFPYTAPSAPAEVPGGANPGVGGALIGNGVMSPNIQPNPPPPGMAATQWGGPAPAASSGIAASPPAGAMLGTDGYYYRPDGNGGYDIAGRVPGYTPAELYDAANQGAFRDPDNIGVPEQPTTRPGGQDNPIWNAVVSGAGGILGNTAMGGIVKTLFPDFWNSTGETIKGLDTAPRGAASASRGEETEPYTTAQGFVEAVNSILSPDDEDDDDADDGGNGGGGTPGTGTGPIYDRFGDVVFPDLPPYNPGRDDEWLYFRQRPELRDGGIVRGYAAGGQVAGLSGQDPRVQMFAEAEVALSGAHPNPGPVLKAFVKAFGPEALEMLKNKVRERGGKSRMVRGPGGGRDDAVPARINGVEEARLSDGEFVMTADAVAGAGDGDPMAGAQKLMELNERLSGRPAPEAVDVEVVA